MTAIRTLSGIHFWDKRFLLTVFIIYLASMPVFMICQYLLFKFWGLEEFEGLLAWEMILLAILWVYLILMLFFSVKLMQELIPEINLLEKEHARRREDYENKKVRMEADLTNKRQELEDIKTQVANIPTDSDQPASPEPIINPESEPESEPNQNDESQFNSDPESPDPVQAA